MLMWLPVILLAIREECIDAANVSEAEGDEFWPEEAEDEPAGPAAVGEFACVELVKL
jgi:hypothetical protein